MNIIPMKPKSVRESTHALADQRSGRVIAVTSGKGGVGKTNVTSNLAVALARQGHRVCVFDADTSLANVNLIMGVTPRHTIEQLLNGERSLEEILIEGPEGVMIVPAASGIAELAVLDEASRTRLIDALRTLESNFDYLLIDTAAGIGESVLAFVKSAQYTILVISTEPTSLTDAFALLRVLKRQAHERPAYVLVNMALNYANSMEVYKRFEGAVRKYLGVKVHYLGYVTDDKALKSSISQQRPVLLNDPDALASRCFTTLAAVLGKQFAAPAVPHAFTHWWSELADTSTPMAVDAAATGTAPAASPAAVPEAGSASDAPRTDATGATAAPTSPIDAGINAGIDSGIDSETDSSGDQVTDTAIDTGTASAPFPPQEAARSAPETIDTLGALAARARTLLGAEELDAGQAADFLEPLLELCVSRFRRLPVSTERLVRLLGNAELREEEIRMLAESLEGQFEYRFGSALHPARANAEIDRDRHEQLLQEYRDIVARLSTRETELEQALQRLHEALDQTLDDEQP